MRLFLFFLCCIFWGQAIAFDYSQDFYEALNKKDFENAENVLNKWEAENKDNPEAIIARFNLLLNKAHNSYIVIDEDVDSATGDVLMLSDMEGNTAGVIRQESTWNDSLVYKAVEVIDHGIKLYPDRLDMRFGKATFYNYLENWNAFSLTAMDILERAQSIDCKWSWDKDEQLPDSTATELMFEGIHEYERILASNTDNQELLDLNLKYYPNDHIALTLKGAIAYNAGDNDAALELFNRAHNAAPGDMLIVCNLAILYQARNDLDMAKKMYQSVLDNPEAEIEWKTEAEEFFKQLDANQNSK